MGWNGSGGGSAPVKPKATARKPSPIRGLVAGLVVVVLAVGAYFAFFSGSEKPQAEKAEKGRGRIKEVTPAVAPTNAVAAAPSPAPIDKSKLSKAWQKYYDGRDTNKWTVVYNPLTKREYISRIVHPGDKSAPPPLYAAHSLNILDAIAFKPIVNVMANVRIDERFMKNLEQGLIEKIEIKPDDSEDIKARKQGMIDLVADLKKRLKGGEDLQKVISDALADRNRAASLKVMMQTEMGAMRRNGASEQEISEFREACNKRLEESGVTPILSKEKMLERIRENQAAKDQK